MPHTTFSLEEVAEYLHIPVRDIGLLVRDHTIPVDYQGTRMVFRRKEVDAWANQRIMGMCEQKLSAFHRSTTARAHDLSYQHAIITELCRKEFITAELYAKTKPSVIRDMLELAEKTGLVNYPEELSESVENREKLGSTAMPGGFALLHPEHHDPYMFEDSFIVLARSIQQVPFRSPDGQTTSVFFLVCCQDDKIHLHVTARLCMMCQHTSLIYDLREAATKDDMFAAIRSSELEVIKMV